MTRNWTCKHTMPANEKPQLRLELGLGEIELPRALKAQKQNGRNWVWQAA